jgi:hypothetical protein
MTARAVRNPQLAGWVGWLVEQGHVHQQRLLLHDANPSAALGPNTTHTSQPSTNPILVPRSPSQLDVSRACKGGLCLCLFCFVLPWTGGI